MSGAEYMVRGLGYLRSLSDLENVPVATKNGTPVLVRDLGTVAFGPDIRSGAADWQGEGETVGGIVVMRYGMNALNVINGVKAKMREIAPSLPPGVEIVTGYDRSWLINESIKTLKRDLIVEADHRQLRQHRLPVSLSFRAGGNHHAADCAAGSVHPDVLPQRQFQRDVARWVGAGNWRAHRRRDCDGGERI